MSKDPITNNPMSDKDLLHTRICLGTRSWALICSLLIAHWTFLPGAHWTVLPAPEPWADERLPVKQNLELWFDLSHQNAGRGTLQLAPLASGNNVDYLLDGSGHGRHLAQPSVERRPRFRQDFP